MSSNRLIDDLLTIAVICLIAKILWEALKTTAYAIAWCLHGVYWCYAKTRDYVKNRRAY